MLKGGSGRKETMRGLLKEIAAGGLKQRIANSIPSWEFTRDDGYQSAVKIYDCSKLNDQDKKGLTYKKDLGVYVLGMTDRNGDERLGLIFGKIPLEATNEQVGIFFNKNYSEIVKNKGEFGELEFKPWALELNGEHHYQLAQKPSRGNEAKGRNSGGQER